MPRGIGVKLGGGGTSESGMICDERRNVGDYEKPPQRQHEIPPPLTWVPFESVMAHPVTMD